jgi:hypothetical protein
MIMHRGFARLFAIREVYQLMSGRTRAKLISKSDITLMRSLPIFWRFAAAWFQSYPERYPAIVRDETRCASRSFLSIS